MSAGTFWSNLDVEFLIILGIVYLFLVLTLTKLGSYKKCGSGRAFLVSLLLTPIAGVLYVSLSPLKQVLKTVHYRCRNCRLEYTTFHRHCPSCLKTGEKHRLEKIVMKTF
ncbi:MAG: hypothetical protein Kow00127_23500 [Bacteroidales bacterium]